MLRSPLLLAFRTSHYTKPASVSQSPLSPFPPSSYSTGGSAHEIVDVLGDPSAGSTHREVRGASVVGNAKPAGSPNLKQCLSWRIAKSFRSLVTTPLPLPFLSLSSLFFSFICIHCPLRLCTSVATTHPESLSSGQPAINDEPRDAAGGDPD